MEMKYKMKRGYNWGVTHLFWGLFCFVFIKLYIVKNEKKE